MAGEVRISVRNLVEFILRSGDIDDRRQGSPENAMQEGSRIHRMIQRRMGAEYQAEVALKYTHPTEDYVIIVEGRADGIILNPGGYAHYSVAILDALRLCGVPAVEVLLSEPDEHEPFRKTDIVSFGCQGHFIGEGPQGYLHACIYLAQLLRTDGSSKAHIVM